MCRSLGILAGLLLLATPVAGGEAGSKKNVASGGRFALEIEGVTTGFLKSVDGGGIGATLASGQESGTGAAGGKRIAAVTYEDFSLTMPVYAPQPVADWIRKSWAGDETRRSGKVIAVDNFLGSISERAFSGALITELTFPACDLGGKDQAYLTMKVRPESIHFKRSDGAEVAVPPKAKRKKWIPSNFRLRIKGLDTSRVVKIDAFTVARKASSSPGESGAGRGAALSFPNLRITIADQSADSWIKWHEDFAIKGNNSPDKERTGDLELLDVDKKSALLTLRFKGLGIIGFVPDTREPGEDEIHYACFDLYCNGMSFEPARKAAE
jgi:hypothetical protein